MKKIMMTVSLVMGLALFIFGDYSNNLRLSLYGVVIMVMALAIVITWIIEDFQMVLKVMASLLKDQIKFLEKERGLHADDCRCDDCELVDKAVDAMEADEGR